jgi:hypothetical protein
MFGSSLPPVDCRMAHVLFTLFVMFTYSGIQNILCCVIVLFVFDLCTLCCQFLYIIYSGSSNDYASSTYFYLHQFV